MTYYEQWRIDYEKPIRDSIEWYTGRCRSLELSADAKAKYSPGGIALPLPGFSIVHWLGLNHQTEGLSGALKDAFDSLGLSESVSFLPVSTHHITLYDLAVWPDKNLSREIVAGVSRAFQKHVVSDSLPKGKLLGVSICAGTSIVAWLRFERRESLESVMNLRRTVRNELAGAMRISLAAPESFLGHMTLAYFTKSVPPEQYRMLNELLSPHRDLEIDEIPMRSAELRYFGTMDLWSKPLASIPLRSE